MPVTNYYSVGGEILGEETGGVRRDYLTDALGSVTATVTSAGAIENTYRYTPYGAQLSKTGSAADPAFTWVGKWGYRQTAKTYSDVYIRARNYASVPGRWITVDRLGYLDGLNLLIYVSCNPVMYFDPSGNKMCCCCPDTLDKFKPINILRRFNIGVDLLVPYSVKYIDPVNHVIPKPDCRWEWWEKSIIGLGDIYPPGKWFNGNKYWTTMWYYPDTPPLGRPSGFQICMLHGLCGPCANSMYDQPHIARSLRSRFPRGNKLCIKVIIRNASGCPCHSSSGTGKSVLESKAVIYMDWNRNPETHIEDNDPYCDWENAK